VGAAAAGPGASVRVGTVETGQPIAELTRRAFELWNAREFDALLECFEEDAVWDMSPAGIPGMGAYRGHPAIRRWFGQWLEVFPDSSVEVESVGVRGDWGFVTILQHVSGGSSGAPVPFRYFGIGRWRDGRLMMVENYIDREKALAAFDAYTREESKRTLA
jgi:ketosteroid isomerase-like protein